MFFIGENYGRKKRFQARSRIEIISSQHFSHAAEFAEASERPSSTH
jgi:hypothetical protein